MPYIATLRYCAAHYGDITPQLLSLPSLYTPALAAGFQLFAAGRAMPPIFFTEDTSSFSATCFRDTALPLADMMPAAERHIFAAFSSMIYLPHFRWRHAISRHISHISLHTAAASIALFLVDILHTPL
jgi:hypothetical protein